MKLSELIGTVGDENVTFQNLAHCLAGVKNGKKDSRIEFYTDLAHGHSIAKAAALGKGNEWTALVVWMPSALVDSAIASEENALMTSENDRYVAGLMLEAAHNEERRRNDNVAYFVKEQIDKATAHLAAAYAMAEDRHFDTAGGRIRLAIDEQRKAIEAIERL